MGIEEVSNIIGKIAGGLKDACVKCLQGNSDIVILAITEQLYCGLDGDGNYITPNYDDDPYFDDPENKQWYKKADKYKEWKRGITPPQFGTMLGLAPRPDNIPNLKITGKFYSEINAQMKQDGLLIDSGTYIGPDIVEKYEENGVVLLDLGPTAMRYFNEEYMIPAIKKFFNDCGYR